MAERMILEQVREWCRAYPKDPIFVQDGYDYGHWILSDEQEENFFTRVIMEEIKCWTARPTKEQMISIHNDKEEYADMEMIPTKANDFAPWSHKQIADYFWQNLGSYVKEPCLQTLQNMKYAWLWAIHDDHELANAFEVAMRWSGIDDIYAEFEKHEWD